MSALGGFECGEQVVYLICQLDDFWGIVAVHTSHCGDLGGGIGGLIWEIYIQVVIRVSGGIAAGLEGAIGILTSDLAELVAGFAPCTLGIIAGASGLADTAIGGLLSLNHRLFCGTLLEGLFAPVGNERPLHCNELLAALVLVVVFDGTLVGGILIKFLWGLLVAVHGSVANLRNDSGDVGVDFPLHISDNADNEVLADLERKLAGADAGSDESVSVIYAVAMLGEATIGKHLGASAELASSDMGGFVFHVCVCWWLR